MSVEELKGLDMESILKSVKAMLGLASDYTPFDNELIMHINSVFTILRQLGVGTKKAEIEDEYDEWQTFFSDDYDIGLIKSYVYLKVRQLFDPPTSSGALEAIDRQIKEFEWRLNVEIDPRKME